MKRFPPKRPRLRPRRYRPSACSAAPAVPWWRWRRNRSPRVSRSAGAGRRMPAPSTNRCTGSAAGLEFRAGGLPAAFPSRPATTCSTGSAWRMGRSPAAPPTSVSSNARYACPAPRPADRARRGRRRSRRLALLAARVVSLEEPGAGAAAGPGPPLACQLQQVWRIHPASCRCRCPCRRSRRAAGGQRAGAGQPGLAQRRQARVAAAGAWPAASPAAGWPGGAAERDRAVGTPVQQLRLRVDARGGGLGSRGADHPGGGARAPRWRSLPAAPLPTAWLWGCRGTPRRCRWGSHSR